MKPSIALALFALSLSSASSVWAGPYEDGVAEMRRGDYAAALKIWSAGADADPRSQYSIGYLYQYGLGVDLNPAEAAAWYEKAGAAKLGDAYYALGLLYEDAKLGKRDLAKAMAYYKKATELGPNSHAEYALGRMYLRGRGVASDPDEAVKWLKLAAEHGNPAGQYSLAGAYDSGWGVKANPSEALFWYMMAARNDQMELSDHDMSFQPEIAIQSLKARLSPATVKKIEARVAAALPPPAKTAEAPVPPIPEKPPESTAIAPDALAPAIPDPGYQPSSGTNPAGSPNNEKPDGGSREGRPFPLVVP